MSRGRRTKTMFVTGGTGFIGRHLLGALGSGRWELIAPPSTALDIRDAQQVSHSIGQWKPTAVVHLAYRRDDHRNIVTGSVNVARAAAAVGARLIHLSTDVVFGGRPTPYAELDAPTPITEYGRWKAQAEAEVLAAHPAALLLRTSLVYGSSRLAPIQADVEAAVTGRSTMSFFTDEVRCPVHASDLVAAIAMLAERTDVIGPLHVAGPQALSRADFAREIAVWMGRDPSIVRTSTIAASGQLRPARVVLDTTRAAALGVHCRPVGVALRS